MFTPKISIQFASIFIFLIVSCSAYQSCSSIQYSRPLSHKILAQFAEGCDIEPQDGFSIELPLLNLSGSQPLSQLHINLNNGHDIFHINIIPSAPAENNYELEVISNNKKDTYSISSKNQAVWLVIQQGVSTISFENSSLKLYHELTGDLPYTLNIQLPNEDLPKKSFTTKREASLRFLGECEQDYFLVDGTCMKVCPAKQFSNNGVCAKCPDKCYIGRCISETMCNPCKNNQIYSKETNTCVDKCPETYFEDYNNKICVKCSEGCKTCSFPNGLCSASYFKTDMIINLIVSVMLLGLITLFACLCNKDNPEAQKEGTQEQQAEQVDDQNGQKAKGTSDHIKKFAGVDPQAPYYVLPENFNFENEDELSEEEQEKRPKRRLNEYAKSKLLSINLHKKSFMIDDADEEKAISHGSATRITGSTSCLTSKTNSPLFKSKRRDSKNAPHSAYWKRSHANVDETMTPQQNSYGELASPYSVGVSALVAKKETSLGLMIGKKKESVDATATLNLDTLEEEDKEENELKLENQGCRSPLHLPDLDKTPTTVQEAEENEELEDIEDEIFHEKEGYKCDLSVSQSKETEGVDFNACTICNMNKRDCISRPCGHMVGCYACMEQFMESYGVCPRCKNLLISLEKVSSGQKKKGK